MRVLLIEQYGLGDAVFSLPVLARLRQERDVHLAGVPSPAVRALREAFSQYDETLVPEQVWADVWDAVLDLTGKRRTARLARRTRARVIVGTPWWLAPVGAGRYYRQVVPPPAAGHVTQARAALLVPLGLDCRDTIPHLEPTARQMAWAADRLQQTGLGPRDRLVALHPGGHSHGRQWPAENYLALGEALSRQGVRCLLVGEEAERPLLEWLASCFDAVIAVAPDMGHLAALLAHCRAFVGGDSGPLHLAAAAGTPVVGIYGRSDPTWSGPVGAHAGVVRMDLPCSPCRGRPHACFRPCLRGNRCLRDLPVNMVLPAVHAAMEGRS